MKMQRIAASSLVLISAALCALGSAPVHAQGEEGFVALFDGRTLNGWKQLGGKAKYEVVDNMIVGTTVKGEPNSFLCTTRDYADFVLELEFLVDKDLNSGIQIRSHAYDEDRTVQVRRPGGEIREVKVNAGRVHGYQVEIDPSERAWTGGIYDEARRGWLNDLKENESARKAFRAGAWNKLHIEARGDSIKTWLNGVPAADLTDDMTPSGFIGLQVHSTRSEAPLQVRWRNIRIRELR